MAKSKAGLRENIPFREGIRLQELAFERVKKNHTDYEILGFEFLPVVTLGKRASQDNEILRVPERFEVAPTDRGGRATLHAPGQLVIFPVVNLKSWQLSVRDWVCLLLKVGQRTFASYGVNAEAKQDGLYTSSGKIGFVGLRIRQGISTHGVSLNIANDLKAFDSVLSCGERHRAHDALSLHSPPPSLREVFATWVAHFERSLPFTSPFDRDSSLRCNDL